VALKGLAAEINSTQRAGSTSTQWSGVLGVKVRENTILLGNSSRCLQPESEIQGERISEAIVILDESEDIGREIVPIRAAKALRPLGWRTLLEGLHISKSN